MNRFQYLEILDKQLTSLPYDKRRDIMYDYEEFFKEGLGEGKNEEELVENLGTPEKVALQYVTVLATIPEEAIKLKMDHDLTPSPRKTIETPIEAAKKQQGNSSGTQLILTLTLGFFNFVFGFWVFFVGYVVLFALIVTGIAVFFTGIAVIVSSFIAMPFISLPTGITQSPVLLFLAGLICLCIGGLMLIALFYTTKFSFFITKKYIQWNIHVIRGY